MRNQTWLSDGTLVQDIELYTEAGKIMARDYIKNIVREATPEEQDIFLNQPINWKAEWTNAKAQPKTQRTEAMLTVIARHLGLE